MLKEVQRLCIRFSRGEEIKYVSHLDLMRTWERVLRRAGIALAYSQGFTPHPRVSLAAPLPLGITSEAELMDVFLNRRTSPHFFLKALGPQLPRGLEVMEVQEIPLGSPSLQSSLRSVEYRIAVRTDKSECQIQSAIAALLAKEHLPWQHMRDTGPRQYDLRALIEDIWVIERQEASCTLGMSLFSGPKGTGRAEQVVAALGFADHPDSIHRTRLNLLSRKQDEAYPDKARRDPLERGRARPGLERHRAQ